MSPQPQQPAIENFPTQGVPEEIRQQQESLLQRVHELEADQTRMRERQDQLLEQIRLLTGQQTTSAASETTPAQSDSESFDWLLGSIAVFACAVCVILALRMRHTAPGSFADALSAAEASVSDLAPPSTVPQESTLPPPAPTFVPSVPEWDASSPVLDLQARAMEVFAAPARVQPYDSTIELADIMLSFGRVNSAAEALADYIEHNPKVAVTPWLKLLDVYRKSGQRAEFDKIAQKLNKTFNVWTVDWDNFDSARDPAHGIEEMHHILGRLQEIWGTRECQAYLQYLLRDTRSETRRGFSLTAIDDILCLSAILELDLGPYTGPVGALADTPADNCPPTETDEDSVPPDSVPGTPPEVGDASPAAAQEAPAPLGEPPEAPEPSETPKPPETPEPPEAPKPPETPEPPAPSQDAQDTAQTAP
ncbi:MAG: hypothetical protein LBI92_04775 [Azoarcus sp.]|nr:hypothetical protein [Azoarcus sp.]